jgi:hypothetical protein
MSDGAAEPNPKAERSNGNPFQRRSQPSEATATSFQNSSPLRNQQDRPHEFYVKKSGSVDVKKGVLFERSEFHPL